MHLNTIYSNYLKPARLLSACCLLVLASLCLPRPCRADTVIPAQTNAAYNESASLQGLQAASNTGDFSVTAWDVCRYIDVATVPGGEGLLIPFASRLEWRGGLNAAGQTVGFIATSHNRPYVTLDFCRPAGHFPNVNYAGGLSNPDNVVLKPGQQLTKTIDLPQKRVDAQHDDAIYDGSLRESMPPESFNMHRDDCLPATTYPDGSVRTPCYSWSWVEQVTASFRYDNHMTRPQAQAAGYDPDNTGSGTWIPTLARACGDLSVKTNDDRDTVTNSCPPAVKPPVLRNCQASQHDTRHWEPATYNNTQLLHDCAAGTVEGPERLRHWDTEAEYWCFDGKDYPTGSMRDANPHVTGACTPVTACTNGGTPPACAQPQCAPLTETRQSACAAGQQGFITEARQKNIGNACGVDGGWSAIGNTCTAICTQAPETRSSACAEGQTGQITEGRMRNQGNVCNNDSGWAVVSNTCVAAPVTPTCSQSVESRNGTCPAGYGGTVVERRLTNIGNVCNANGSWTPYSSNCSSCTSVSTVTLNCTAAGLNGTGFVTSKTVNNTCDATHATTYTANSGCCMPGLSSSLSTSVNGIAVPGCD